MKNFNRKYLIILLTIIFLSCAQKNYLDETKSEKEERLEWWKDAKFGMFIHWGIYSVPAGWYKNELIPGASEWITYFADIPQNEYVKFAKEFNPINYDPKVWVKVAKQAGMKYIVITSKHHDGFCLWDSKYTKYDVVDATPYSKDLLKPLYDACLEEGIKIGFYHSILDWNHPDANLENFNQYRDNYLIPQLEELLEKFPKISILWFDGEWIDEWTEEQGKQLYNKLRNISPNIVINNRIGKGRQGMQGMNKDENSVGDFGTPEQEILETASTLPWEACMTMNDSWGFKKGDDNWKSDKVLVENLVDIVAKGGNYLLNIGPNSKGEIPAESIDRLKSIGNWIDQNGEGIYTSQTLVNYSEGENIHYTKSKDGKFYYIYVFNPSDSVSFSYLTPKANSEIKLLSFDENLTYTTNNYITKIELPNDVQNQELPICLKLKAAENDVVKAPIIKIDEEVITDSYLFQDSIKIKIFSKDLDSEILFSYDEKTPIQEMEKYNGEIPIILSTKIYAIAVKENAIPSKTISAEFRKITSVERINLYSKPSEKYTAKGSLTLVDGQRGETDYTKNWLGFEGDNFEAKIDLGESKYIKDISLGFLSTINSWIFLPKNVKILVSENDKAYVTAKEFNYEVSQNEKLGPFKKDISANVNSNIRFIKIEAESIGQCPDWHIGKGGKAWIFIDEIVIQ